MKKTITNGRSTAESITMGRSTTESVSSSGGSGVISESHTFTGSHTHMYDANVFPDIPACPTGGSEICPVGKEPLGKL